MGSSALNSWKQIFNSTRWFFSPHLEAWQKKAVADMRRRVSGAKDSIWLLSSGTQSVDRVKAIGLAEDAIFCSAESVNRHLESTHSDRWLLAIPHYHIGGLSIFARAWLSGAKVFRFDAKWDAKKFADVIEAQKVTLTSLVPTQVFDLVKAGVRSPVSLRAAVIGGGAFDADLYRRARQLGWPVLPSYGLTECSSQVATADLGSLSSDGYPGFSVLSHVKVKLKDQRICLQSGALCRWIATGSRDGEFTLENPLREGWFETQDLGELKSGILKPLGRRDDVTKILGVLVSIPEVEEQARLFFREFGLDEAFCLNTIPDPREGRKLVLILESEASLRDWDEAIRQYNARAPGPRRIRGMYWVPEIPRTDLGKVKRGQLKMLADSRML